VEYAEEVRHTGGNGGGEVSEKRVEFETGNAELTSTSPDARGDARRRFS